MKNPLNFFAILVTSVVLLALPAAASAEYLIPDGNSAVNQYTEGIPTGGGEKETDGAGDKKVKPAQTIGAETTRKLEDKGREGQEVAEVAAETAPPAASVETGGEPSGGEGGNGAKPHKGDAEKNSGKKDDGGSDPREEAPGQTATAATTGGDGPSGSGGFGEIVAAATGGSDGGIGLLLPLTIFGALVWGIILAWRRHDDEPTAAPRA